MAFSFTRTFTPPLLALSVTVALALALPGTAGVASAAGGAATPAAPDPAKSSVTLTRNGAPVELRNEPLRQGGSVLLPLREIGALLGIRTTWIPEGKRIVMNSAEAHIQMQLGSVEAVVNDGPYTMPAMPDNRDGVVYVPVRFVSEALGATVNWVEEDQRVDLFFEDDYLFAERWTRGYWIHKASGDLSVSENAAPAASVGRTSVEIKEYGGLRVSALSPAVDVLTVTDNYGEPHLNDDVYKLVVNSGKVTLETKVHYWGHHPIRNSDKAANSNALLIDGTVLYEVDAAGAVAAEHDLRALTGYEDKAFQVEWYDEQIMAVRPHDTGWLTLIDRKSGAATKLIDRLGNKAQLDAYKELQELDPNSMEFANWDGLKVLGRDGSTLKLSHVWFLDPQQERVIEYQLAKS